MKRTVDRGSQTRTVLRCQVNTEIKGRPQHVGENKENGDLSDEVTVARQLSSRFLHLEVVNTR
jgi:hypothetical protein